MLVCQLVSSSLRKASCLLLRMQSRILGAAARHSCCVMPCGIEHPVKAGGLCSSAVLTILMNPLFLAEQRPNAEPTPSMHSIMYYPITSPVCLDAQGQIPNLPLLPELVTRNLPVSAGSLIGQPAQISPYLPSGAAFSFTAGQPSQADCFGRPMHVEYVSYTGAPYPLPCGAV